MDKNIMRIDKGFCPICDFNRSFRQKITNEGESSILRFSLTADGGRYETFEYRVLKENVDDDLNFKYAERLIKSALWIIGGFKLTICCDKNLFLRIFDAYRHGGLRDFDVRFFEKVYGVPFKVEYSDDIPDSKKVALADGIRTDGKRIGLDAGGSDIKIASVDDGKVVFSREIVWHPKLNSDPEYHIKIVDEALKEAASKLPYVDSIGVSSAGIHIDNETRVASLFIKIAEPDYDKAATLFSDAAKRMNVPLRLCNDGDVAALAGAIELNRNCLLGIAMGTSEAAGYADKNGRLRGWLSELAFVPVDVNENAAVDEWSGDYGCGVKYLSQDGVIKLADMAGLDMASGVTPAEKLKIVQGLVNNGDGAAEDVFTDVGTYLAYTLMYYSEFYEIENVLLMGRVVSGRGGEIIIGRAREVLADKGVKIELFLPDEKNRRVGQAVAAAYL